MRRGPLLALGIAVFLITAVLHLPAALLVGPLRTHGLLVYSPDGSLSQGSSAGIGLSAGTPPLVHNLAWTLQPAWLLLGRAAFRIQTGGDLPIDGDVQFSPGGTLRLKHAVIDGSTRSMLTAVQIPYAPVTATVHLELDQLLIRNGHLMSATGRTDLKSLSWTLGREPILLGDFSGDITTEGDTITLQLRTVGGPLDVTGSAQLRASDQHYQLDLQIRPKPDAADQIRPLLKALGPADGQGFFHLRDAGELSGPAGSLTSASPADASADDEDAPAAGEDEDSPAADPQ